MLLSGFVYASHPIQKEKYLKITVESGDTLWGIANEYRSSHQLSTKEFIEWVMNVNHLPNEKIAAGEKLVIPVLKSKAEKKLVVSK